MRTGAFFVVVAAVVGLLVGRPSPAFGQTANSTNPPPVETQTVHRSRMPLVVGGYLTFAASYGLALIGGAIIVGGGIDGPPCHCASQFLLWALPVVGPVLGNAYAPASDGGSGAMWPFVLLSGVEAAGAAMLTVGLIGEDVPVPDLPPPPPKITVIPIVTRQLSALSLNIRW